MSTVATVTEIAHYLRLLFAKLGVQHCDRCGEAIRPQSAQQMLAHLRREFRGETVTVLAPAVRGRKGIYTELFRAARKLGFARARIDGVIRTLHPVPALARYQEHDIDIVIASLTVTRSETAKANIKEGLRLHQIAGRPTKQQLILVFGKSGYLLTWPKRTEKFGITPETFQAALAKGVPAIRLGPGTEQSKKS